MWMQTGNLNLNKMKHGHDGKWVERWMDQLTLLIPKKVIGVMI